MSTSPKMLEVCRALAEFTDDLILVADWETARFVEANPAALRELGYSLDELRLLTGGDLSQFPREEHRRVSQELIEKGETRVQDVPIRRKDGSLIRRDLWVRQLQLGEGKCHVTVMRRCRAGLTSDRFRIDQRRLLESEAFYRGVVTCTEDAVVVTDRETGEYVEANPAACTLFGYTTAHFRDVRRGTLFAPPADDLLRRIDRALRETGHVQTEETRLLRKDGTVFIGDTVQNAFENDGRQMTVMVIRDVSERRRNRQRLERSQRLAAVGEVAAGVVHEINNPAAFIAMNHEAIERHIDQLASYLSDLAHFAEEESDPDRREALRRLVACGPDVSALREATRDNREGIERIRAVTRDLRVFARAEERTIVKEDLNAVVRSALKLVRNELRHRAQVELVLADDLPSIPAQRGKLAQVVTNLLLNALQAITEGNAQANRIRITTCALEEEIELTVEDSGEGIGEEVLAQVFQPFFTTKPTEQGTGLGLALCANIVAAHRGRIEVTSTPGTGSKFRVRLPLVNGLIASATATATPTPEALIPRRILVIDDDPGMVRAYRRMLRAHDTTVVSCGAEALALLARDGDYDLILCDLMMPEVDGPQVHDTLMARAPHLAERIVFCTGGAFTNRARDFVAHIDNEVIEKPLSREDLSRLLRQATPRPRSR